MLSDCSKVFKACFSTLLLLIYQDSPLDAIALDRIQWLVKNVGQTILFSSKFKPCICGIRSPGALSPAKLLRRLRAASLDPQNINNITEHSTSDYGICISIKEKIRVQENKQTISLYK